MWYAADSTGHALFSVWADSLYALDKDLFCCRSKGSYVVFRNEPFNPLASGNTRWLPGIPGMVLQQRGSLYFPTHSGSLKSMPGFVFDSVFVWNQNLLGRYRHNRQWVYNPGSEKELLADSIQLFRNRLVLFQYKGLVCIDAGGTPRFISNTGARRSLNPFLTYTLADSLWQPVDASGRSFFHTPNETWWNDTSLIDTTGRLVMLQSPGTQARKIADSAAIINQNFIIQKSGKGNALRLSMGKVLKLVGFKNYRLLTDSLLAVEVKGGWFLISALGQKVAVNKTITDIGQWKEGMIMAKAGRRYGFIDASGFIRIACRYDSLVSFSDGLAAARIQGQWGFLNKSEQLVVQPHFSQIAAPNYGLFPVALQHKWGLMANNGTLVLPCQYDSISPGRFVAWRIVRNKWMGMADRTGKVVLQTKYFHSIEPSTGWIQVQREGKSGLFSSDGKSVLPLETQTIIIDKVNSYLFHFFTI